MAPTKPYFGFTGGWLTFWVSLACATDMTLFGYDQGVFSERLGRKNAILLGCTIMAIGTVLKASSYNLAQMFVGRSVLERFVPDICIGNGISAATAPVWQTETAQAKWRGKLVILYYQSPKWLLFHGRDDEALEALSCIEAVPPDDPYIKIQYDEFKYSIAYERRTRCHGETSYATKQTTQRLSVDS
ncbi:hypothetical protein AN4337.2 [Aspergillus nidulans FGSC A4]|uniref:Major facilitator superfamily (MFS) profile domain-containing protein n=1 Tax=Emericella nidulans (strain FGSC A4 / ATCC 38163 / CBS 112.46 / NRRL 194 / M139) TaxID=227321 RepID=Q5B543_EMENI|nr:hypothetical protein [Aspergillus nidulans FGSC A4]EAA60498.1 hypothetical protein AN4337.2 [Aspergillus nidulans FGSC A4]CBF77732.1 TPA: conserved hypothetical protein [Aspergillus nidulans FGSC A4]|eukprot:XP_661941.1 hypothetical protein AN4337.2 [Aspergillus nidulans FGSC A4]